MTLSIRWDLDTSTLVFVGFLDDVKMGKEREQLFTTTTQFNILVRWAWRVHNCSLEHLGE